MRLVTAKKGVKNELPEIATADDWSDVGYVALGGVRRSCSYTGAADGHTHTNPTDGHTHTSPAHTDIGPTDGHTHTSQPDLVHRRQLYLCPEGLLPKTGGLRQPTYYHREQVNLYK
jgi:hypothetical protein